MMALLWARVWKWVCALGAILAAIGGIWLWGRAKGKQSEQANTRAAQDAAASAQAAVKQMESRHATDIEVAKLPDAPAQRVGDAAAGTAAGELRDTWTRD